VFIWPSTPHARCKPPISVAPYHHVIYDFPADGINFPFGCATTGTVEFQRAGVPGNWNGGLRDYVWEMMIAHLDTSVVLLALPSFWKDDGSEVRMRLVMSCT
jgi:hypothetical protein